MLGRSVHEIERSVVVRFDKAIVVGKSGKSVLAQVGIMDLGLADAGWE